VQPEIRRRLRANNHRQATITEDVMSNQLSNRLARATRRLMLVTTGLVLTASAGSALAHHAFAAEYDGDKSFDLTGVVTKARWVNPHSWLYFDVKNADGSLTNWGVELAAPNALATKGIAKTDLGAGARVHVKGFLSKNGGPWGYASSITLADGRKFETGGAPNSPAGGN
jgi:hypothetical protein